MVTVWRLSLRMDITGDSGPSTRDMSKRRPRSYDSESRSHRYNCLPTTKWINLAIKARAEKRGFRARVEQIFGGCDVRYERQSSTDYGREQWDWPSDS